MSERNTMSATHPIGVSRSSGWANGRGLINVRPIVPLQYGRVVFFVLGGKMSEPQAKKEFPDRMYVDVSVVAIKSSALMFLVCLFSLAVSIGTGLHMIHPFAAIMIMIGCVGFYLMGRLVKKQHNA
jgi:hypothetical protein